MELDGGLFSNTLHLWVALVYGFCLLQAVRMAPWRRFRESEQRHVFLGAVVALIVLWLIRTNEMYGFEFHLLGVTTLTLMFGWSLTVIASSLALLAVTLNQGGDWASFAINALLLGLLPITISQTVLVIAHSRLPKNYFIFILINAFFAGGLVAVVSGCVAMGLLVYSGAFEFDYLQETILPFFPLMFLPEAFLNGWATTILISFRPQWVAAFSDELYIKGK